MERPPLDNLPGLRSTTPPESIQKALLDGKRPCGEGRFAWQWAKGPTKGEPIVVYCAEPRCLTEGACTGPRFVPSIGQFDNKGNPRKVSLSEGVLASRLGAEQAREQTGRGDDRSDDEIAKHVAITWQRGQAAAKGGGFK